MAPSTRARIFDFLRTAGRRWGVLLPYLLLAAGAGIRIAQYLHNRSLWFDEVSLVVNIVKRDFAGLFDPLRNAVAPPFFLVFIKAITLLFGTTELALRLLPLLGSLAGLLLFWKIAKDLLPRGFAVLALTFLAFSYPHIFYAQEVKQYSVDVAVVLFLVRMMILPPSPSSTWRVYFGWGLAGAATLWLSWPSVFVLGSIGMALMWSWLRRPERKALSGLAITAALWAAGAAVLYFVVVRRMPRPVDLQAYWSDVFLPWPTSAGDVTTILKAFHEMAVYYGFPFSSFYLVILFAVVGAAVLWKIRPALAQAVLFTVLLAYLASALHRYPLDGRLALFLSPFLFLFLAAGAAGLCRGRRVALGLAVSGVLLAPFLATNVPPGIKPIQREEIKPLLAVLEKRIEPGDYIAIYYKARRAFDYYWSRYKLGSTERLLPGLDRDQPFDLPAEKLAGRRVWLVITHASSSQESWIHKKLPPGMKWLESYREYGASLHLYQYPPAPPD